MPTRGPRHTGSTHQTVNVLILLFLQKLRCLPLLRRMVLFLLSLRLCREPTPRREPLGPGLKVPLRFRRSMTALQRLLHPAQQTLCMHQLATVLICRLVRRGAAHRDFMPRRPVCANKLARSSSEPPLRPLHAFSLLRLLQQRHQAVAPPRRTTAIRSRLYKRGQPFWIHRSLRRQPARPLLLRVA